MKRLLLLLLIPALLLCPAQRVRAEEAETAELVLTGISDAEGFRRALEEDPFGAYALLEDLDLGGADWEPLPFYGVLDGLGHTVYNLTVRSPGAEVRETRDGNFKPYDTVFAGLFSVLENADVRDLRLIGASVSIDAESHCFAALLAGGIWNASIQSCALEGRVRLNNSAVMSGVGGAAGYGRGTIRDCAIDAELVFVDRSFDARCEQFMGGVLSCGIGEIADNTVTLDGWDSCHGYVHNGGLVGMYYYCGIEGLPGPVTGNTLEGQITFFEDNWDRRAYCSAVIGETLSWPSAQDGNDTAFASNEVWTYDRVLLPEQCETPSYVETVTEPGCETWGFTEHRCEVCRYGWTDAYTPPAHTPGEWSAEADAERLYCAVCGTQLDERELPPPPETPAPAETPEPEPEPAVLPELPPSLRLRYRESAALALSPGGAGEDWIWTSTDRNTVSVDQSGNLYALRTGEAEIVCASPDGGAETRCAVTVILTPWQWILRYLLFGWLWY